MGLINCGCVQTWFRNHIEFGTGRGHRYPSLGPSPGSFVYGSGGTQVLNRNKGNYAPFTLSSAGPL